AGWIASIRSLGLRVTSTRVGPACYEQTAPGARSAGRDVLLGPLTRASQDEEGRPAGRAALPVPVPCEVAGGVIDNPNGYECQARCCSDPADPREDRLQLSARLAQSMHKAASGRASRRPSVISP